MGAGGPLIFDDDVAWDVKGVFDEVYSEEISTEDIIKNVQDELSDYFEDEDDSPIAWCSLAALLIEKGILNEVVKKHALEGIEFEMKNEPGGRWLEEDYVERKKVLEEFREILLGKNKENFSAVDQ